MNENIEIRKFALIGTYVSELIHNVHKYIGLFAFSTLPRQARSYTGFTATEFS